MAASFDHLFSRLRNSALVVLMAINVALFYWAVPFLSLPSSLRLLIHSWWTPVTYMVVHRDVLHILFNMLWLWWFGRIFLLTLSQRRLLGVYLGGGLCGAAFYLVGMNLLPMYADSGVALCGASAAVMAIMGVTALRSPDYEIRLVLIGNIRLKWIAVASAVLIFIGFGGGNAGGGMAHLGGLFFGCVVGILQRAGTGQLAQKRRLRKARRIMERRQSDIARLDSLLDTIRTSGFNALSSREKIELNILSKRLNKKV